MSDIMMRDNTLQDKTVIITAGNRGGGAAVATRFAESQANVVIIAPKDSTNPITHEISDKIIQGGGKALTLSVDLYNDREIYAAVDNIIGQFNGIDILINNFSIFNFKDTLSTTSDEFNKVMGNVYATFFMSQACIPHLKNSHNPHVINISPPLDISTAKVASEHHLLFSIAKYGMSFCTLGMSAEFSKLGIGFNSLWQAKPIFTATLSHNFDNVVTRGSNKPEIYAEAAYLIAMRSAKNCNGQYFIDETILQGAGIDIQQYAVDPSATPVTDIFLPGVDYNILKSAL